ncbi:MAG: helix-turn-helix domain-containing protein [Clostridia bacterium]|nr:helix-turn-helix domain-containing protein [Clostridia bacterium]
MLGNFEKRRFEEGKKVWCGSYKNLVNVLHWHFENEIIMVKSGKAKIKIGDMLFQAAAGDSFFCVGEKLHYIMSEDGAETDIMIFDESICGDITDLFSLTSPKISNEFDTFGLFGEIRALEYQKSEFYREQIENRTRGFVIDLFSRSPHEQRDNKSRFYKNLIWKINEEFAYITFADAVKYSGYSPSHFSKLFKELSGMSFTEYLNTIKVEHAAEMLKSGQNLTATAVSLKCGFSTVRNFNKVFKEITGFSPKNLPKDYRVDYSAKEGDFFDPTDKRSILA